MSDNAEAGIARTQAAVAKSKGAAGLKEHHNWNIAYLNERILVSLMAIATLGLIVLWATATSKLVIYGSFAVVIALTFLWGFVRIKRIEADKRQQARQAESWQSGNSSDQRESVNTD
jgi:hypothetical protein